jgi:hypothetical protein
VLPAGGWVERTARHTVTLDFDDRFRRRKRYVAEDGTVRNEGDVQVKVPEPYGIAYGALVPKRGEASNLLVPVCCSASHIAYGSIRMEPVFMVLAQSAMIAGGLALELGVPVQDVPYERLRERLLAAGQVLSWSSRAVAPGK